MNDISLEFLTHLTLLLCSTLANTLSAVSGGGAGFIQFPILILFGLPFLSALGTHKASTLLLGIGACFRKSSINSLKLQIALILIVIGIPGCIIGTLLISVIDESKAKLFLGILTIVMAFYSIINKSIDTRQKTISSLNIKKNKIRFAIGVFFIFLIAILSGALSSGAGLFATMAMVSFFNLDIKSAINHSVIFIGTLWNFVGAATVYQIASIHWQWVPTLLLASFLGGFLGSKLLNKLSSKSVRYIFASVSFISGIILIYSSI